MSSPAATPAPADPAGAAGPASRKPRRRKSMKTMREKLDFLRILKDLPDRKRVLLLKHLSDDGCNCVFESISNVLSNPRVPESHSQKICKSLAPHYKTLRYLCKKRASLQRKRNQLYKVGGFPLGLLLSSAVPLLASLITRAIRK